MVPLQNLRWMPAVMTQDKPATPAAHLLLNSDCCLRGSESLMLASSLWPFQAGPGWLEPAPLGKIR